MAKGITRTLQTTEITVAKFENGELLPLESIIVDGEIEKEVAVKVANKQYKNEGQVVVTDVIVSEPVKRRISIEDFVKYSEIVGLEVQEIEYEDTDSVVEETHSEASGF
jgi:hypothetical protein